MFEENLRLIILFSFVMPVGLSVLLIWFFMAYQARKFMNESEKKDHILKQQELLIQQQTLLQAERNRIAAEMHDDLGSGLTIIKFLSDSLQSHNKAPGSAQTLDKISQYSTRLVGDMSSIIWAMNSRFDTMEGLISYLRRYISEYLCDNNIEHSFEVPTTDQSINIGGEKRRNIFLVVKELLHNSIKYSNASSVNIQITLDSGFGFKLVEVGSEGFDSLEMSKKGNGLFNIEKRINAINGTIRFERQNDRMLTVFSIPLEN